MGDAAGAAGAGGAAGTGGAGAGTAGGAAGAAPPDPNAWMGGFSDDQKAFVTTKGYKGPVDILESYRNLEKLHGVSQDRIIKLPEKMDSPEMRAVWEKLGAPKDAAGYEIATPKGGDEAASKAVAEALFKAGVPKSQAKQFIADMEAFGASRNTAAQETAKAKFDASELTLKKDWGAAYDQNVNLAKEAARITGFTGPEIDALAQAKGHDFVMKAFHKMSKGVTEADFVGGKPPPNGILTPDLAKGEIKNLMRDKGFQEKILTGDREATAKWQMLHEQAFQGMTSL
jgi:hypothetical protein